MTTQEMHIEIDLELQKINSQNTKNLLPQEKDWFLNNEVRKFIEQRINPQSNIKGIGFQGNAKRVEDLKDLIRVKNVPIEINNRGKKFITLPSDYFTYIRFDSFSYKNCTNINVSSVPITEYSTSFDLNIPDVALTIYKIELITDSGTTTLFDIADLPTNYLSNDEFKKQKFLLINALKIQLLDKVKEELSLESSLYWERKAYDHDPYIYTLVSDTTFISIKVTSNANVTITNMNSTIIQTIPISSTPLKGSIRVIDEEFLTDVENSHLSKSRANSPISSLSQGVLEIIEPSSVVLGSTDIIYICTPIIIDLLLDSNLNMSNKVVKEVVGNTIRFLKAIVQDPNYQIYAQENILIE